MSDPAPAPPTDPLVFPRLRALRRARPRSTTWWGRAFVRSLEETAYDEGDLVAGRSLARSGRLGAVVVLESMASAVLDPSREESQMVQVKVRALDEAAWQGLVAEAVREAGHLAALESGQLPADLVEHADERGIELLPVAGDLETACECDAWTQPCRHALALLYQLAWHLDRDPYLLLMLRGHGRDWFLDRTTAAQDATPEDPAAVRDAQHRAGQILALAEHAPTGHGLTDAEVAAYDEAVSRLVSELL